MTRLLTILALQAALLSAAGAQAGAQTLGLAMPRTDDAFRSIVGASIEATAAGAGLTLSKSDARNDPGLQIENVRRQIAEGVSALVVLGVDDAAEREIARLAREAGVPLVFVNHEPDHALLGQGVAYVGSNEIDAGRLQAEEVCAKLGGRGTAVVLIGELSHPAARARTLNVHDVFARPDCRGIEILEEQSANWDRTEGQALLRSFYEGGLKPDAVLANNDEMALGAVQAAKQAGLKPLIAGIDATDDALASMKMGQLSLTVLQDGKGQGQLAVELARRMMAGGHVEPLNWIPFVLIRPEDVAALQAKRAAQ